MSRLYPGSILTLRLVTFIVIFSGVPLVASAAENVTEISVDTGTARFPVSSRLYGAFYEEINRAGDGGLYAEQVRNRSFEDTVLPERCTYRDGECLSPTGWKQKFPVPESTEAWEVVQPGGVTVELALERESLMNASQVRSLRMVLSGAPGLRAGLGNRGFGGVAVQKGKSYRLTFHCKTSSAFTHPLSVELRSKEGAVLASATVAAPSEKWSKREIVLQSSETDAAGMLCLLTEDRGTCWLDEVSLFPCETFHHRPNGLRTDLAEKVAALKPQFLRFPGGCIVEGFSRETIWHWKDSVGDTSSRRSHFLLWGYRTTMGLGFDEFLQFCEDLKMAPLFVFNCGMTCQGRNCDLLPDDQVEALLQEALDGLEYANGSVETPWGAERAKNGHPAPYNIEYVEIGNENNGAGYESRYARFYRAIRERFPSIKIIANSPLEHAPVDILDEHYYASPDFFIAHHDHYDSYSRDGSKIYVGEFAATEGVGNGNLRGAVGEAAFLTGIERNQDIVGLASYAPLFANFNERVWTPDAIYFDNHRVFGTPSYEVLKMFASNRGDVVLPLVVSTPENPFSVSGTARIELSGKVEYENASWESVDKTSGAAAVQAPSLDGVLRFRTRFSEATAEATLRFRDNGLEAGQRDYCSVTFSAKGGTAPLKVRHVVGWVDEYLGSAPVSEPFQLDRWYSVELRTAGAEITLLVDGKVVLGAKNRRLPAVTAVATKEIGTNTLILKLVNTSHVAQAVHVRLKDAQPRLGAALRTTLTSEHPEDENSFETPDKVVAKDVVFEVTGPVVSQTLAPDSVNVLRLPL